MEMLAALKARREALESKLKEKNRLLKELCIKEGDLIQVLSLILFRYIFALTSRTA